MAQVAVAVAISAALSFAAAAMTPHPKPSAQELQITSSAYGDPLPVVYGDTRLATRLIWSDGQKHVQKQKKQGGGVKGKKTGKANPYIQSANLAFAICEGPVQALVRIWANGALIYDVHGGVYEPSTNKALGTGKYVFRFYNGGEDQTPDPLIKNYTEIANGPGSTPAYRGTAYIVFENMVLTDFGNQIPNIHVEVLTNAQASIPSSVLTPLANPKFSLSGGTPIFDYTSQTMYWITSSGISTWDLIGDQEIKQQTWSELGYVAPPIIGGPPNGKWALIPGGYLVCAMWHIGAYDNGTVFLKFDAKTLQYVNSTASLGGLEAVSSIYGVPVMDGQTPIAANFAVTADTYSGKPTVIDLDANAIIYHFPPSQVRSGDPFGGGAAAARMAVMFPETGHTDVYFTSDTVTDGHLGIYRVRVFSAGVATGDLVDVVDLTAIDSAANGWWIGDLQADTTDGGLCISLSQSSSPYHKVTLKWLDGAGVLWSRTNYEFPTLTQFVGGGGSGTGTSIIANNRWGWADAYNGFILDTSNGNVIWDRTNYSNLNGLIVAPTGYTGGAISWDALNSSMLCFDAVHYKFFRILLGRFDDGGTSLGSIVADVCSRAGLDNSAIDVSALTQNVSGYVVGRRTDAKSVLAQLSEFYFFDAVESGDILKFVPRGTDPSVTITQADLGETRDERGRGKGDQNYWKHVKKQEMDLPWEVTVRTFDPARNLQYGMQTARRTRLPVPTMHSGASRSLEAPIVMSADEAKQIANKRLFEEWIQRDSYTTTLGLKWAYLEPTDVVQVTMDNGDTYVAKLDKNTLGANLVTTVEFLAEDNQTYSQPAYVVGASGDNLQAPTNFYNITQTNLLVLDLPLIRDTDNLGSVTCPLYLAPVVYSHAASWPGAEVEVSKDSGASFSIISGTTNMPWSGTIRGVLPNTKSPFMFDSKASITVYPFGGVAATLANSTLDGLDAGDNMMLVGNEIIAFLNATHNTDGSYTLTGLYRGLRGTDWACTLHMGGEVCVLLTESNMVLDTYSSSNVGNVWQFKAITYASFPDAAFATTATLSGAALKPYPVSLITSAVSGSDLAVSWVRRTRIGGGLVDGTGTIPLNEDSEAYEAYILSSAFDPATFNPTNAATYVRKISGLTSPTFTYTAAQMAADSFSPTGSTLHVVIYQLSAEVGRGFPGFADIPPPA